METITFDRARGIGEHTDGAANIFPNRSFRRRFPSFLVRFIIADLTRRRHRGGS